MGQMREANERLIVAAVDAQNRSDEADAGGCAGQDGTRRSHEPAAGRE